MAALPVESRQTPESNTFRDKLSSFASSASNKAINQVRGAAYKLSGNAPFEDDYKRVNDEIKRLYDAYIVNSGLATITDKNKLVQDREYINNRALGIITRRLNYLDGSSVTDKSKIPNVKDNLEKAEELKHEINEKLKVLAPGLFDENGNFKEQKKNNSSSSPIGLSYAIASVMNGVPSGGSKRRHKRSTKKLNKRKIKTNTGKSRKSKSKKSKSKKNKGRKNK